MAEIVRLEGITRSFDGLKAIDGVSMTMQRGIISAIIGANGAGKTTLFNIICGFLTADEGKIIYNDRDITMLKPWERASVGIGRLFQDIRVFKKLTLLENLFVTLNKGDENPIAAVFGRRNDEEMKKRETAEKWLDFVGLIEMKSRLAEDLSWGQQKLLGLARLLCGNFEFFLIDEPVTGVHPDMIRGLLRKIQDLKELGKTIIIVEHDMDAVKELADDVYYMDSGKIIAHGDPVSILNNQEIMDSYRGLVDVA